MKRTYNRHGEASHCNGNRPTKEYMIWIRMVQRCEDRNVHNYHNYGGRGIRVCERWRSDYLNFLTDMGRKPEGKSLDRIDNNGNYELGNCRWATPKEQRANRRPRTACYKGHPFVEGSYKVVGGNRRLCLICRQRWDKSYYLKTRTTISGTPEPKK